MSSNCSGYLFLAYRDLIYSNNSGSGSEDAEEPISTPGPGSSSDAVLKGTKLATMGVGVQGDIFLYYHSGDGGLRYISESGQKNWQGPRNLPVKDAKLGTPLASTRTKDSSGGTETVRSTRGGKTAIR